MFQRRCPQHHQAEEHSPTPGGDTTLIHRQTRFTMSLVGHFLSSWRRRSTCCESLNLNMNSLWAENGPIQTPPWIMEIYKTVFIHIKGNCVPCSFHHGSCRQDWWLLSFPVATDTEPLSSFPVRIFAPTVASFCSESWTWLTSSPCVCNKHIFSGARQFSDLSQNHTWRPPLPRIKPQHSLFKRQLGTGWYISDIRWLIQLVVGQKPTKHRKAIILQLKTN